MKIKTQLLICIIVFSVILLIIAASVANTEQQVSQLNAQEEISNNIERGASNLNSISVNYFLYQQDQEISQWNSTLTSLSSDLANLKLSSSQQQTLAQNVTIDLQSLNVLFDDVVSYLQSASRNVSVRIDPAFQLKWSTMAVQGQTLTSDASHLSSSLNDQAHQVNDTNILLIVSLVGTFGAFLIIIYLLIFRRTLKSVTELQNGINRIGAGNLDYSIKIKGKNEITELSRAFNQMSANLKNVTASKTDLEQTQASLRESEQRWATTLASIGDAVIATDVTGRVMFMNGAAEELTGWTLSESSQKPVKEVFNIVNEQTRSEVENPVNKVLEKGLVVGLANHTVLIRKNKTEVAIDDSGAPIKDKEGKTTGVVLIFRDITERKKAEEAVTKQAELIDLSPVAIIVCNLDGVISFWSKGAEKLYGWTKGEAIGQDIHSLLKTEFHQTLEEILNKVKMEGKWSGELVHTSKDGSKVTAQSYWLGKYGADGKIVELLESNVDITERIRMQTKIEESAVLLEEYANQMEELANKRAEQLKDAERLAAIGATAGMVGHDIRNPLQAITSDIYLAKTELASTPETEEKSNALDSLTEIEKNIDYINKIVSDLQDFARPLTPKIEEIDLEQTVHSVLANLNIPGNVTIKHSIKRNFPKIKTDQSYMQRILTNLANNAIQAMPKGGKIAISAIRKGEKAIITVEDNGEGIPENVRGKLFTPLVTTKSKGQGFGLSVVKRFTEGLGGTVTFESEVGKGTKFIIELPL